MGVLGPSGIKTPAAKAKGVDDVGVADLAIKDSGRFRLTGAFVEAMMGTACEVEALEGPASPSELDSTADWLGEGEVERTDTEFIMAVKSASSRWPDSTGGSDFDPLGDS